VRVGSLFSGIGGFDLGLERAGFTVAWQCEADEFCRRVLAKHWPGVPCHPDVRTIGAVNVEPVDVLCGGFPCQDISTAGRGAGIDGARSGLWAEYARLIRELRPRYVVVENVAALLARGLGRVVGDLAACGYDAEWDCVPASAFGAPHRRDRLWLIAYPDAHGGRLKTGAQLNCESEQAAADGYPRGRHADRLRDEVADTEGVNGEWPQRERDRSGRPEPPPRNGGAGMADADRERQPQPQGGQPDERRRFSDGGNEVADTEREGLEGRHRPEDVREIAGHAAASGGASYGDIWATEPDVGRVAHGVPDRVDRLRSLGNALVPQIAQWLGERILEHERRPVGAA
jgi:DNA (cytosine-5)-methyltransferase 1